MIVAVTGAGGFVGKAVSRALLDRGHTVRALVRSGSQAPEGTEPVVVGDLTDVTNASDAVVGALDGAGAVVHLAARVHVMDDRDPDPEAAFQRANVAVTDRLAVAASGAGVGRFVFLSSVKVSGEATGETPFRESDPAAPEDAYGRSKWQAEQAVTGSGVAQPVILRPPLVYGPGVRANFEALIRLSDSGLPLPLGGLSGNRRSLIYLGNLADAIVQALAETTPAGTYLVRDGEDLSTADLVRRLRRALGRPARLLPIPAAVLRLAGRATGRSAAIDRLAGSLQVDDSAFRAAAGWTPPYSVDQGLAETVRLTSQD